LPKSPMLGRAIEILMVEDNPDDIELTQEALKETKICNRLHIVRDGDQALRFLQGMEPYTDVPRPDLIFLDLNLPKRDGREVLAEIKADEALRRIPVVILTTSQAEEDILQTYELHANCYITKPVDLEQFIRVVRSIEQFWFTVVRLPGE